MSALRYWKSFPRCRYNSLRLLSVCGTGAINAGLTNRCRWIDIFKYIIDGWQNCNRLIITRLGLFHVVYLSPNSCYIISSIQARGTATSCVQPTCTSSYLPPPLSRIAATYRYNLKPVTSSLDGTGFTQSILTFKKRQQSGKPVFFLNSSLPKKTMSISAMWEQKVVRRYKIKNDKLESVTS